MSFHTKNKWVIGLTGSILSGKSTALGYFKDCGAGTISCDEIVRELYKRPAVLKKIKTALGTTQKDQIAQLVFKSAAQRKTLEKLLHPLILKEVKAQLKKCTQTEVVEVPLLFEAGWNHYTDLNIAVLADPKTLPARLKGRKLSLAQYKCRLKYQWPDEKKAACADVVFFHTDKRQLKQSVTRFCHAFNLLHKQK